MKTNLIIIGTILLSLIWLQCTNSSNSTDKKQNTNQLMSMNDKENKDLVIIIDAELADIEKAIQDFCNTYNAASKIVFPRLNIYANKHYEIRFPRGIEFDIMCYFVNYMHYPFDITYSPNIIAWTTIKSNTSWVGDELKTKEVMMYIPKNDTQFDYVCFVTKENKVYKNGFAVGEGIMKLKDSKVQYIGEDNVKMKGELIKTKDFE